MFLNTKSREIYQESHVPGERDLSTLKTAIIPAHFCLLLQNPLHTEGLPYVICLIDPTNSKCTSLHLVKSSERTFFVHLLYQTGGSAAWFLLLSEAITFPPRRTAERPILGTSLMAEVLQSRGDPLTFASFCSFFMTVLFMIGLAYFPNRQDHFPSCLRTVLLSHSHLLACCRCTEMSSSLQEGGLTTIRCPCGKCTTFQACQYSYKARKPLLEQKNSLHFSSFFLRVSLQQHSTAVKWDNLLLSSCH